MVKGEERDVVVVVVEEEEEVEVEANLNELEAAIAAIAIGSHVQTTHCARALHSEGKHEAHYGTGSYH